MAENLNKILMGARGWLHPGWRGYFYPDDLPQDWQLNYYSNEFSMLVIREQEWRQLENIARLQEDCGDGFRFVVELPPSMNEKDLPSHLERIQQLGKQCAGVIVQPDQFNRHADWPETIPIYIDGDSRLIKIQTGIALKELRARMEVALQTSMSIPALLVVDGKPPDIELLRNAQTLLELL